MVTTKLLSEEYGNPDIYKNYMIGKAGDCVLRRVYASEFEDESLKKQSNAFKTSNIELYPYMLGYIHATRLLDIYHSSPNEVLEKFNNVLSGKESVNNLLDDYNISLENKSTVSSLKNV